MHVSEERGEKEVVGVVDVVESEGLESGDVAVEWAGGWLIVYWFTDDNGFGVEWEQGDGLVDRWLIVNWFTDDNGFLVEWE